MYVPEEFALADREAAFGLMRRYDFALLVTAPGGAVTATHLPFILDQARGERGTLIGHMARANPQWRGFAQLAEEDGEALVVFQGAHAYVSPRWYGHQDKAVPTWNYMAVHAYGPPRVLAEPAAVRALLERLIETQEAGMPEPWSLAGQPEDYLEAMMRGIVAFEIPVARLEAKAKLSQNKTAAERVGVVAALAEAEDGLARAVSEAMKAQGQ